MYNVSAVGIGTTATTLAYTGFEFFWPLTIAAVAGALGLALLRVALVDLKAEGS